MYRNLAICQWGADSVLTFNSTSFDFCLCNCVLLLGTSFVFGGPGISVGTATDYGLDGPGSNPGGDETFRPSRPALGPTQPLYNGYRVFPGGKVRPRRTADYSPPSSAAVME